MTEPLTILLTEDDEGHATLVQRNLRRAGLEAEAVRLRDGQELLDYLHRKGAWQQRQPHHSVLILLDLNMPRLGGFEVLARLKDDETVAHIPVFVLTTTDNPVELARCYTSGASACVVKPLDYGAFGDVVRRLAEFLHVTRVPPEHYVH
jgi:CheY-like chemotaxis protein